MRPRSRREPRAARTGADALLRRPGVRSIMANAREAPVADPGLPGAKLAGGRLSYDSGWPAVGSHGHGTEARRAARPAANLRRRGRRQQARGSCKEPEVAWVQFRKNVETWPCVHEIDLAGHEPARGAGGYGRVGAPSRGGRQRIHASGLARLNVQKSRSISQAGGSDAGRIALTSDRLAVRSPAAEAERSGEAVIRQGQSSSAPATSGTPPTRGEY